MVVLKNDNAKTVRTYEHKDGLKYPSVTEVLGVIYKPHLEQWRRKVGKRRANEVSRKATTLGTSVHSLCQKIALGASLEDVSLDDPQKDAMVGAYINFLDEYVDKVLLVEKSLVSATYGVGGTLDLYCVLKGGQRAIVDIKTSKNFDPEMGLQMAGYKLLLEEEGHPVDKRVIVRLSKDKPGKYYVKFFEDHERDISAFQSCVNVWFWRAKWDHFPRIPS